MIIMCSWILPLWLVVICCTEATSFVSTPSFVRCTTPTTTKSTSSSLQVAAAVGISTNNLQILSERGRNAILSLIQNDPLGAQAHVYNDWPEAGIEDDGKQQLADQVSLNVFEKCSYIDLYVGLYIVLLVRKDELQS